MVFIAITGAFRTTSKEALLNALQLLLSGLFAQKVVARTTVLFLGR